jgi:hypothetical protein
MNEPADLKESEMITGLRNTLENQMDLANKLRLEIELQKQRADNWRDLATWAYQCTCKALMMPQNMPREARRARDQALNDINKKLGGMVRC